MSLNLSEIARRPRSRGIGGSRRLSDAEKAEVGRLPLTGARKIAPLARKIHVAGATLAKWKKAARLASRLPKPVPLIGSDRIVRDDAMPPPATPGTTSAKAMTAIGTPYWSLTVTPEQNGSLFHKLQTDAICAYLRGHGVNVEAVKP